MARNLDEIQERVSPKRSGGVGVVALAGWLLWRLLNGKGR